MTARRLALPLTISLLTLLLPTAVAQAAGCDYWYGPGGSSSGAKSGEWGEKTSWSTGEVPAGQTEACVTIAGTYTVSVKPFFGSNARVDVGAAETLKLGAASGTQTLRVIGENYSNGLGNEENQTSLFVTYGMTIGTHGVLVLDASEGVSNGGKGTPGGNTFVEEDVVNQPGHPFINEGTIISESASSKWSDGMHVHSMANSGSLQVNSPLKMESDESSSNTGSITTSSGTKLEIYNFTTFTNNGQVSNSGSFIFNGYPTKGLWVQGSDAVSGNAIELQNGAGLQDSSGSGAGSFRFSNGGGGLIGVIPKGQTIDVTSGSARQSTLYLANDTGVNEGTIHLEIPSGAEDTNIEEGSLVNKGTIEATVENPSYKNVIDVPLTNEPGGVLEVSSGTLFDNREITNNGLLEVAPGAIFEPVATKLVNGAGGTIALQISGASTFGKINLGFRGELEAGGTLAPTPVGGFAPGANEEFEIIEGSPVRGTFATVLDGFSADYTHESSEPPYVGVVYGTTGSTGTKGTGTTGTTGTTGATGSTGTTGTTGTPGAAKTTPPKTEVVKVSASAGLVSIELNCPKAGGTCGVITVEVTLTERLKKHGRTTTKTVVVASGTASLNAGAKTTLKLHINGAGKALLRKHHSLKALVTVTQGATKVATQKVTLKG